MYRDDDLKNEIDQIKKSMKSNISILLINWSNILSFASNINSANLLSKNIIL